MARPETLIGRDLGTYRILKLLGSGGMGAVYLAEHRAIGHKAAIKVLLRELAADEESAQRFFNEARAVNLVKHPGIVQIFDYGQSADAGAYLVMEYLEGQSLGERLRAEGPLPPAAAARVLARVCSALDAAHQSGLIHRDMKPDNIFLSPDLEKAGDWRVKVLDFGIAKVLRSGPTAVKTQTGTMVGTPYYMAPEYAHGAKGFDHRIDVYSLGVIAFETLSGVLPFKGEGVGQILLAHMLEPVPPLRPLAPAVSPGLEAVVMRALEKEPAARFQTAQEMARALLVAVGDEAPAGAGPAEVGASRPFAAAARAPTAAAPRAPIPAAATPTRARLPSGAGAGGQATAGDDGPEPTDLPAEATTVGPPRAPLESLPTVIRAVPTPPMGSSARVLQDAAAPPRVPAEPPSTLSVTAAEIQPAAPPAPARRSVVLVAGLAAAALVAAAGTAAVLTYGGSTDEAPREHHDVSGGAAAPDDSAGKKRDGAFKRDADAAHAPRADTTTPAPATSAPAPALDASAAKTAATAAPAKKLAKKPTGAHKAASASGTAEVKDARKLRPKTADKTAEMDLAD
jgi:tRNA A-37 threonylcarbamoyl transferase component Bud32